MSSVAKAFKIILVTPDVVALGLAKDSVVYYHSPNASGGAWFTKEPFGDEGFILEANEVVPYPNGDVIAEDTAPVYVRVTAEVADGPPSRGAGLKFDGGKPRPSLLINGMPRALSRVVDVLTFGAAKYEAHSWQQVENGTERYADAKLRHMLADAMGEECDSESEIEHLAHEACNILFLLELKLRNKEEQE